MRTAAALRCRGPGHDIADFGVIWGRFFFDQKSTFFNFDFDKKWFGGGLDPLAVDIFFADFFFSLRALLWGWPKNNLGVSFFIISALLNTRVYVSEVFGISRGGG